MSHPAQKTQVRDLVMDRIEAIQGKRNGAGTEPPGNIVTFEDPGETDAWPGFFDWLSRGANFELLEMDITPGDGIASAWALFRLGSPSRFRDGPERLLRITLCLQERWGEWQITHEHQAFTDWA